MTYAISVESSELTYPELDPLYRQHYAEMSSRVAKCGVPMSPYNPRIEEYLKAADGGWLLTFVLRHEGIAVGYCNIYLTNDMHNRDLIAQEDTLFVLKEHRNGVGKKLVLFVLDDLRARGVRRLIVSAMTDLRVAKLWQRMGFTPLATQMAYVF